MFKDIEHIATASICVLVLLAFRYVQTTIFSRLRRLPGPPLARLTAFYRALLIWSGSGPAHFYNLHSRYGPLVRTGPKHVLVSDSAAVSEIFNSRTKFLKVKYYEAVLFACAHATRVGSTIHSRRCTMKSPWTPSSPHEIRLATRH